jgi:hypothetical protein
MPPLPKGTVKTVKTFKTTFKTSYDSSVKTALPKPEPTALWYLVLTVRSFT